jgi:GNAT superfamily N-acetyltransferase
MSQSTCTVLVTPRPQFQIRRAQASDAGALSALCRAAKGYWGYPPEWLEAWASVLRISPRAIREEEIFWATLDDRGVCAGFFGFRREGSRWHLEHFWLAPEHIGRGLGRALFADALREARRLGISRFQIKADPNAEGFYLRMGAQRVGEERYVLLGKFPRVLPLLRFDLPPAR